MSRCCCRLLALSAFFLVCANVSLAADLEINWRRDWASTQAAARASGKYILAYIYQHGHSACVEMDKSTFSQEPVITALDRYETMALNGSASTSREFCTRYSVGVRSNADKGMQMDFAAIPAYLFLDAAGNEYHRTYGFYPPVQFVQLLERTTALANGLVAYGQRPNDARLNADIGRVYLDLELTDKGRPYLERAVKLDPENTTGARADAELDLTILTIPDNPDLAFRQLVAYLFNHPETSRRLEVRYFMAVAAIANEQTDQAERILLDFAAIPPMAVDGKPTNPDYTNRWTVMADLLYKQLKAPPPANPPGQ